ncbi:MAG: GNAT family N-acetyltransferase [Rhodospirillales bacterium]|nr:MAG: GNAT family N-acetyltransferase [Rhodospirillales bacterium]
MDGTEAKGELTVRVLRETHAAALAAALAAKPETHLFLRANLAKGGIEDTGKRNTATWVGAVEDNSDIAAAAALCWNGACLLHAPEALDHILDTLAGAAPREALELAGPADQVVKAELHGWFRDRSLKHRVEAMVMTLALADLRMPAPMAAGTVDTRPPMGEELAELGAWHADLRDTLHGDARTPENDLAARQFIRLLHDERRDIVATVADKPVAYAAVTIEHEGWVNVGAVYTPPDLRGRGYARCAVAGLLRDAAKGGATHAMLTVTREDPLAARVYAALGFVPAYDWTVVRYHPA